MIELNKKLIPSCPDPNKDGLIWKDISNEIKLTNQKANPFGWSQSTMVWNHERVGFIESGSPRITGENYQMVEIKDPSDGINHVFFFKGMIKEDWDAISYLNEIHK